MNPEQDLQSVKNPLAVMQPGERVVCEIQRHPIGLIGTYVVAALLAIVGAAIAILVPHFMAGGEVEAITLGVFAVILLVAFVVAFVGAKVYKGNRWVVTSDSITQMVQTSLFDKRASQLSMGNIEDVTAEQDGIVAHMFNYGRLRVETAGERSKFVFVFCPNPNYYAQQILAAREAFEQGRMGEDRQRLYRAEGTYAQNYQQPQPPADPAGPTNPPQDQQAA